MQLNRRRRLHYASHSHLEHIIHMSWVLVLIDNHIAVSRAHGLESQCLVELIQFCIHHPWVRKLH